VFWTSTLNDELRVMASLVQHGGELTGRALRALGLHEADEHREGEGADDADQPDGHDELDEREPVCLRVPRLPYVHVMPLREPKERAKNEPNRRQSTVGQPVRSK
jgi:hypothetical protein